MKKNILVLAILAITLTGCGYKTSTPQQIPENFINNNATSNNYNSNNNGMHNGNKRSCNDGSHYSNKGIYSVKVEFNDDNLEEFEFFVYGKDENDMYEDQLELLGEFVTIFGYFPSISEFNGYNLLVDDYDGLLSVYNEIHNKN